MTKETFDKITPHIPSIELTAIHGAGNGDVTLTRLLMQIQREYNNNPKPIDTSCGSCITELYKDVYRHYKQYENTFSK